MKAHEVRVPTNYAVSRKQRRMIARRLMEQKGVEKPCHHDYTVVGEDSFRATTRMDSYFSQHWRDAEYQEVFK